MDFEKLNKHEGELHPYKTAEIKEDLLKERKEEIQNLLAENNPEAAEKIINELNEGDFRWEEKRQKELILFYYNNLENYPEGKDKIWEIIARTKKQLSQEGRINEYKKIFKEDYVGPRSSDNFIEDPKTLANFFRNALYKNDPTEAEKLLIKIRAEGNNEKTDHRESELIKYYIKQGNLDASNRVIENMVSNEHNEKYNSKQGRINILSSIIDNENKEK